MDISATIVRQLKIHFNSFKMDSKLSVVEHLRKVSTILRDYNAVANIFTEE